MDKLSPREREIAALVAEGHGNKHIAQELYIAEQTVKYHLMTTYRILDLDPGCNQRVLLAVAVERQKGQGDAD